MADPPPPPPTPPPIPPPIPTGNSSGSTNCKGVLTSDAKSSFQSPWFQRLSTSTCSSHRDSSHEIHEREPKKQLDEFIVPGICKLDNLPSADHDNSYKVENSQATKPLPRYVLLGNNNKEGGAMEGTNKAPSQGHPLLTCKYGALSTKPNEAHKRQFPNNMPAFAATPIRMRKPPLPPSTIAKIRETRSSKRNSSHQQSPGMELVSSKRLKKSEQSTSSIKSAKNPPKKDCLNNVVSQVHRIADDAEICRDSSSMISFREVEKCAIPSTRMYACSASDSEGEKSSCQSKLQEQTLAMGRGFFANSKKHMDFTVGENSHGVTPHKTCILSTSLADLKILGEPNCSRLPDAICKTIVHTQGKFADHQSLSKDKEGSELFGKDKEGSKPFEKWRCQGSNFKRPEDKLKLNNEWARHRSTKSGVAAKKNQELFQQSLSLKNADSCKKSSKWKGTDRIADLKDIQFSPMNATISLRSEASFTKSCISFLPARQPFSVEYKRDRGQLHSGAESFGTRAKVSSQKKSDMASILSLPWIQRWCRSQSHKFIPNERLLKSKTKKWKYHRFSLQPLPSAAAMAIAGITVQNLRPCKQQKRGSFSVWNTAGYTVKGNAVTR